MKQTGEQTDRYDIRITHSFYAVCTKETIEPMRDALESSSFVMIT